MGYPFGTRFCVLSIHSIRSLELFVSLVFTDMLPVSLLVRPAISFDRRESQPPPGHCCFVCRERFDSPQELRCHGYLTVHKVEVYKLCLGAEYCWCDRCGELVKEAISWHIRSKQHVARLPAPYQSIPFYRANPEPLDWHGIRVITTTGVESISIDQWHSIDWEDVERSYDQMHATFRYHNPDFYDRVAEPALNEAKEEKEETVMPPPPDGHPSNSPQIPAAVELNWADVRSPLSNVWNDGGKPLYAPLDPLSPDGHSSELEYSDGSDDIPDFPPSYPDKSNP